MGKKNGYGISDNLKGLGDGILEWSKDTVAGNIFAPMEAVKEAAKQLPNVIPIAAGAIIKTTQSMSELNDLAVREGRKDMSDFADVTSKLMTSATDLVKTKKVPAKKRKKLKIKGNPNPQTA